MGAARLVLATGSWHSEGRSGLASSSSRSLMMIVVVILVLTMNVNAVVVIIVLSPVLLL